MIAIRGHVDPLGSRRFELRQQRTWIENVAARPFRPFTLDQAHDLHVVQVGKPCRLDVEDAQPALMCLGGKRLRSQPAAHRGRQFGDGPFSVGILAPPCLAQRFKRAHHGGSCTPAAILMVLVVTVQEIPQQLCLIGKRPRVEQRRQLGGDGQRCGGRGAFVAGQRLRERSQPIEAAEIAVCRQCGIEPRDGAAIDPEPEVR